MFRWISSISGGVLITVVLTDVYLTVLFARSGAGLISPRLGSGTWRVFCLLSRPFPQRRDRILAFCGPTLLVLIGSIWVGGLMLGFALIIWPALGSGVVSTQNDPSRDLSTAVYISGYYMTTVGSGDFRPATTFFKLLLVFDATVGISLITLMLTYFVQIYNALQRRSTFALKLHKASAGTGDAAELLAGIGADGNFEGARGVLMVVADELLGVYESYHFYEALIFFRFREPHYALPRTALVTMDLATLIRTALDERKHAFLIESTPVTKLWYAGQHALHELSKMFLPPVGEPARPEPPDAATAERWRRRFEAALERLRRAGIATAVDPSAAADAYVALRTEWDAPVAAFAKYLDYSPEETDPARATAPTS